MKLGGTVMKRRLVALATIMIVSGLASAWGQTPKSPGDENSSPARGPVRHLEAKTGDEILTLRYFRIRKGSFPQFLEASERGVWPFYEKIGARIVGMWEVIPAPGEPEGAREYDEVYLSTRYASLEHWSATRDPAALGGDGPDYKALQEALAVRQSLTLETRVTFLRGETGPLPPVYFPPTRERFKPAP
jgi:hypothetical protein